MQSTVTVPTQLPENGRATRRTVLVILAVLWALFGLGCAAWTALAFAKQCESFLMTSSAARFTVLWTGGTWSAALMAAAWGVLRGKAWGGPAALWLCGWMVAYLMGQVAGLLASSGATASALVGLVVAFVWLALVVRWFVWLFGPSVCHPKWLGVVGLLWTGWLWTSLVLPMLDPAANRPAGPIGPSIGSLGCAAAALLWLGAVMVSRGRRRGIELGMGCLTASAIAMSYAVVSGEQDILERFTFAALGACGMVKAGNGLEQLATQYAGECTAAAMCAQAVTAIALLWWRRKAVRTGDVPTEQSNVPPVRSTEAGAVGTPRRFGIGTLMAVTAAFGGLMALLRAAAVPTAAAAGISAFVATVGAAQALLFKGRVPRVGSMVIGALFFVVAVIIVTQNAEPKAVPVLLDHVPWLLVGGGILGYIAGATVAGFFMVLRNIAQRRKPRATSVPPVVADARPRRRWLRMPVRWSTLILLLLIPAGLWLGLEVHPLRRQARAAASLRRLGAEIEGEEFDSQLPWSEQSFLLDASSIWLHNREFTDPGCDRWRA